VNIIKEKTLKIISKLKKNSISLFSFFKKTFSFKKKKSQENLDKNLVYSLSKSNTPSRGQLKHIGKLLSKKEKIIIFIAIIILLANLLYLSYNFYQRNWETFPKSGGTHVEGVLGLPRFINPLYAIDRDVDSDLTYLIYSSLFTYNRKGELVGDLVTSWEVSEDNLEYLIELRPDVLWHNGEELTADDILFTFFLMKDPDFRSPWQRNLAGVELEKINTHTIKFTLQEPYAPFFELLTFGILPRFAWEATNPDFILLSDLNLKPIGSGPYKFKSLIKNTAGEIKEYHLEKNNNYYGSKSFVEDITFKFYFDHNQLVQALNNQEVDAISYLPPEMKDDIIAKNSFNFHALDLPQINALFFNQEKNQVLENADLRKALAVSLNRDKLIKEAVHGYARRSDGPLPISNFAYNHNLKPLNYSVSKAQELLESAGWEKLKIQDLNEEDDETLIENILNFKEEHDYKESSSWLVNKEEEDFLTLSLSYIDSFENKILVNNIKEAWENLGIKVLLKKQSQSDILNNRDFEILLQKQMIGKDPDISAFWHSSQKDSGLNLINYQNETIDELLTDARQLNTREERIDMYHDFQEKLVKELPAIFLYSSKYLYIQNKKLKGFSTEVVIEPRHRFSSINDWYLRTTQKFTR